MLNVDTSNKEVLQTLLSEENMQEQVLAELESQGIPAIPSLKLTIQSSSPLTFSFHDIKHVFEMYGKVDKLEVNGNIVNVVFQNIAAAYFAKRTLHGKLIESLNAKLQVEWDHGVPSSMQLGKISTYESSSKFTCRYEIQIANDREFQVARRLIGAKGCNMKRIVEMCTSGMNGSAHDIVKLRLRGVGSGFKEGPCQEESNEPLHMCVSSKYYDKFLVASNEVEKLLVQIYKDYQIYLLQKGIRAPLLRIKKCDNLGLRERSVNIPDSENRALKPRKL